VTHVAGPRSIRQAPPSSDQVRIPLPSHAIPAYPSCTLVGTAGLKELVGHFAGG